MVVVDDADLVLGSRTTRPDSITDKDCSILAAGDVDGVETTDAFDEEDSDDGSRTECEQPLAVAVDAVDGVLSESVMSFSISESILSKAVDAGLEGPAFEEVELVDVLFAAASPGNGLLFKVEPTVSGVGTVRGDVDDAVDVEGVDEAAAPLACC